MREKKVIVVTSLPPGSLYFLDQISKLSSVDLIIVQVPDLGLRFSLRNFAKFLLQRNLTLHKSEINLMQSMFDGFNADHIISPYSMRGAKKTLSAKGIKVVFTQNINEDSAMSRQLEASNAELALVLGGRILAKETIEKFSGLWINGHGGILPAYRGVESEYWAIRNNELFNVGATIHKLTSKIDQGLILRTKSTDIQKSDTLREIRIKNHITLIDLYISFLRKYEMGHAQHKGADEPDIESNYYSRQMTGDIRKFELMTCEQIQKFHANET